MMRVKANVLRQMAMLWLLIGLPSTVLGDAGHDAMKKPVVSEGKNRQEMKVDDCMNATAPSRHWMAPDEAAQRANPIKTDKASLRRGKQLFEANCVSCHGKDGKGDGPAAQALHPKPADLSVMAGQHPDGDFFWKIQNGRGPMPAWKSALSARQIWDLVNYIQSLTPPADQPGRDAHSSESHDHRH